MSVNYTDPYPQEVEVTNENLVNYYRKLIGLFYTYSCDSTCGTCVGPLPSNCLTCTANYAPTNGVCSPPAIVCDSSCLTCSGSAATQCLTCAGGLTALSGACTCLPNQFASSANGQLQCTDCDSSCSTCNGAVASNCLTCPKG